MANSNLTPRINNLEGIHTTLSNVAQTDINVTEAGSTGILQLDLVNITPATDAVFFELLVSTDGGSNFLVGASDYSWAVGGNDGLSGNNFHVDQADDSIQLAGAVSMGSDVGETINGTINIFAPSGTTLYKHISWNLSFTDSSGNHRSFQGAGKYNALTAITHIRLKFSSGNIESGRLIKRLIGT